MSEFSSSAAETSDMQLVPTTASIAFVWSAATPLSCLPPVCGALPHTPRRRKVRTVRNTLRGKVCRTPLPCASSPNETRCAGLSFGS